MNMPQVILFGLAVTFSQLSAGQLLGAGEEICRGERPHYQNFKNYHGPNAAMDYGVFVPSNTQIDKSYHFEVRPAYYFAEDAFVVVGLRTYVRNSQGQLICVLEGGPMLRSSYAPPETDPNDLRNASKGFTPMKMTFDLRSRNYFRKSVDNAGPHIPVVLLGRMGSVASEGMGPIFGNLSSYRIDPNVDPEGAKNCSGPHDNVQGNFAMIESFRNQRVCVFGKETASEEQIRDTMTDENQDPNRKYHVEVVATPTLNPQTSGIHNQIYYKIVDPAGNVLVEKTWTDNAPVESQHGGWLMFAVIGSIKPWSFDLWIDNLTVEY